MLLLRLAHRVLRSFIHTVSPLWVAGGSWGSRGSNACLFFIVATSPALAEQSPTWAEELAKKFSGGFQENRSHHAELAAKLEALPAMPVANFGGPIGYLSGWSGTGFRPELEEQSLQVNWQTERSLDFVSLIPARVFDQYGLDPQYGLPEDFDVILIDAAGKEILTISQERNTGQDKSRKGRPFCYTLDPPVPCFGLRIDSSRNYRDPKRPGNWQFIAWGEIMCFEGLENVAADAKVSALNRAASPWPWWPNFAADGVSGLGLPEVGPAPENAIGWLTKGVNYREKPAWVELDLGKIRPVTGTRLFPPQRPLGELFAGFAFPERFVVELSLTGQEGDYETVIDYSKTDFLNRGHHAVRLTWPEKEARFMRVRAILLGRISANYPSFFGFSEIEVFSAGQNVARGCSVNVSEQQEPIRAHGPLFWAPESLTDGMTSLGKIISEREWLGLLNQGLEIENQMDQLNLEAQQIVNTYRYGAILLISLVGLTLLAGVIALPIRYKRRETQQLRRLRNRIASDLHDEIGSSLGSIQILTEAAQRKPESAQGRLQLISILSAASVASLGDIVWLLRPGSAFQSPSVSHFRETAAILIDSVDWEMDCDAASRSCLLARATNRQLLLFFREALHNAIRHSGCTSIQIETSLVDGFFQLKVVDDGCGIPSADLESAFCLRALKERASQLNGEFLATSDLNKGTTISLIFPVNQTNSTTAP